MKNETLQEELAHCKTELAALRRYVSLQDKYNELSYKYYIIQNKFNTLCKLLNKILIYKHDANNFINMNYNKFIELTNAKH